MKTIDDLGITVREEIQKFTSHSAEIAIMIINFIRSNEGMTKKDFAKLVGKTPSDVTRWVSGSHNFTIETLSLIEVKTGMSIILELSNSQRENYLKNRVFKNQNNHKETEKNVLPPDESEWTHVRLGHKELFIRKNKKNTADISDHVVGPKVSDKFHLIFGPSRIQLNYNNEGNVRSTKLNQKVTKK